MESLTDEVVDEILNGFSNSKPATCPICKAPIVPVSQDLEAKSNFNYCTKCGFSLSKPRK